MQLVLIGPVKQLDGITDYSGSLGTLYVSRNGGAEAARSSTTAPTYYARGMYGVELDDTDTNVGGSGTLHASNPAAFLDKTAEFMVWQRKPYDSFFADGASVDDALLNLPVNLLQLLGYTPPTHTNGYFPSTIKVGAGTGELATAGGLVPFIDPRPTGTVTAGTRTQTVFPISLTGTVQKWTRLWIMFESGALIDQGDDVASFDGTSITVANGFTAAPSVGDAFRLINK